MIIPQYFAVFEIHKIKRHTFCVLNKFYDILLYITIICCIYIHKLINF